MPSTPEAFPPVEAVIAGETVPPTFAAFMTARRGRLTGLWMELIRRDPRLECAETLSQADLADHLPQLFADLEAILRGDEDHAAIARHAEAHGEFRWHQRYSLEDVLKEIDVVCRAVLTHGLDVFENENPALPREQRRGARDRILRFFEQTAAGSVRAFAGKRRAELDRVHAKVLAAERALAAALQSDRDRLADLFQRSPSFIALLKGPDHVFELANAHYAQVVGERALLGRPVREALPEIVEQGFADLLDRVFTTGEPFTGNDARVLVQPRPDRPPVERFVDFVYLPTRTPGGDIDGVFVHGVDWTERRAAQENLRESEARFRQLADVMPQIVWTAGADGAVDYHNRQFYDYTGAPAGPRGDAGWREYVHPEDLSGVCGAWEAAMAAARPFEWSFRLRHAPGGNYRWFLGRGVPFKDDAGRVVRWIGTNTDIHERKQLQEQNDGLLLSERAARTEAERVGRVKDEFLATLSHELRTPLNAILGWTQVLRSEGATPADGQEGLAIIERNARAQTRIIDDLLDMSRIISGKVRLDVRPLDLAGVVEAAVETVRPAATAKGIRLQPLIDPRAPNVNGDPSRLQQVFWNLLTNAVKFTPKGGRVQVTLARVHSHLEVSVSDTGEGIAPEFLPDVFDRFRQQDASTTRRHGGLGLGLAIVKQLAELHGGTVRAESPGVGQGTTFRVALPLPVVNAAAGPQEADGGGESRPAARGGSALRLPPGALQLAGVKVLVVDDEPDARALVKRLLDDRDARVSVAGSAAEAVALLREERPDVLISDIGMPEEDGYALIRRVRALKAEEGGQTPAIALTAYARTEDRLKAILAGFQVHVTKPVDAAELLAFVASLTGRVAAE